MTKTEFYSRIYKLFDNVTPLSKDCGILCNHACCNDGDEETGMLLFPFEEDFLKNADFGRIDNTSCEYGKKECAKIFFCNKCNRTLRPLACRIFPLMPYKKAGSPLRIVMNPMAKKMCPLAWIKVKQLEPQFIKNVRRAMNNILKLEDGEDYIIMLSEIADDFTQMQKSFLKKHNT